MPNIIRMKHRYNILLKFIFVDRFDINELKIDSIYFELVA